MDSDFILTGKNKTKQNLRKDYFPRRRVTFLPLAEKNTYSTVWAAVTLDQTTGPNR